MGLPDGCAIAGPDTPRAARERGAPGRVLPATDDGARDAGWIGGGNIPAIFRELVRGELDVQAIFLAGKNEDLRKEAEEIAAIADDMFVPTAVEAWIRNRTGEGPAITGDDQR